MTTIAEIILAAQRRLSKSSTPHLDAELLVGHALGMSRTQLLASLRDPVPPGSLDAIERSVERRARGEPVAYIVGRKEFLGHDFIVTPAVLTPRPETELLVEWAIKWLADRPNARVVDVGTGSGAIAIGIASDTPKSVSVTAVDISDAALAIAKENAHRLCPGRITFRSGNLLTGFDEQADLVLANLPYLRPDQIDGNDDLAAEPRLALDGGREGLELIEQLIEQLPAVLTNSGAVALELDPSQSNRVARVLESALPGADVVIHHDLAGWDRFVTAVRL